MIKQGLNITQVRISLIIYFEDFLLLVPLHNVMSALYFASVIQYFHK